MQTVIKPIATGADGKGGHCPEPGCNVFCKTLAGLSKHMNSMHLTLSPNQAQNANRDFKRRGMKP